MSKKVNKVSVIQGKVDAVEYVTKNGYPEVGQFVDEKSLQKFYKQLPIESLEDWAKIEGCEYKPCTTSEPIHRMRVAMSILYKHFPKETATTAKPKSKYSDMTTDQLVQMAIEHEVPFELTENMAILRMRAIMALRAAKVID